MRTPLPPEIEVTEDFSGGVHFLLPRRPLGLLWPLFAPFVMGLLFGVFVSFMMPGAHQGGLDRFFPVVFFGGFGSIFAVVGLLIHACRNEVELREGRLRFRTRLGPLPLPGSKACDVGQLERFTVTPVSQSVVPSQGAGYAGRLAALGILTAETTAGRKITAARFSPRDVLEPLADELSARCERLGAGRPLAGGRPWAGPREPRRAASVPPPASMPVPAGSDALPNVPARDLSNQPGTRLRYQLRPATTPGCALLGTLVFCLFWNGIVSFFVYQAVSKYRQGHAEWFLNIFLIPFVLVGLGAIIFLIRQFLIVVGLGATRVEIAAHPLHPGESAEMFVAQTGRLVARLNGLTLRLVCEERATYRQGTNTRTETRVVRELPVFAAEAVELPFEAPCRVTIPPEAMHSFKASHNEIVWKLVARGDVPRWPDFSREYAVDVHPAPPEAPSP